ncbi:MAG: sugar ABC transporter ATP-binding protein, partial [Erysipelotrichaceae bacterium]|nr:sugar ABC transporter ATP-binding protein [Erysipelotrichaceae bacterium]
MSEYLLEMRNICKSFPGVKALDNANLTLKPGHVHALMGENGAGKSTLMKCLFGIYKKDSGQIIYQGEEINNKDPFEALNRGIAMVHQELLPIPDRSIAENIYVGRYPVKKIGPLSVIDHDRLYKDAQALLDE